MTWASHAKDAQLASLDSNLHSALESARASADQLSLALDRKRVLEQELRESRSREEALEKRVNEALKRLENAEVAEERLAFQMGEFEAESYQRAVESGNLVRSLNARLNEKENLLEKAQRELQLLNRSGTLSVDNVEASKLPHYRQLPEQNLKGTEATQLEMKKTFASLRGKLNVGECMSGNFDGNGDVKLQRLLRLL